MYIIYTRDVIDFKELGVRILECNQNAFYMYRIIIGLVIFGVIIGVCGFIIWLMLLAGEDLMNYIFMGCVLIVVGIILFGMAHDVGKSIVG